jgi:hypothetical protein
MAMSLLSSVLLGLLGTFVQSRRTTEASVMHAAATSLVYGVIEQIKGLDYATLVPSTVVDPQQTVMDAFPGATAKAPPYLRVRINQDQATWLQCLSSASASTSTAPKETPPASATAASLGVPDNVIGPLELSSVTGATSQPITLRLWLWIDEMADLSRDAADVKRVTLVYSYTFIDGQRTRTAIDREVFIRTRFDQ